MSTVGVSFIIEMRRERTTERQSSSSFDKVNRESEKNRNNYREPPCLTRPLIEFVHQCFDTFLNVNDTDIYVSTSCVSWIQGSEGESTITNSQNPKVSEVMSVMKRV